MEAGSSCRDVWNGSLQRLVLLFKYILLPIVKWCPARAKASRALFRSRTSSNLAKSREIAPNLNDVSLMFTNALAPSNDYPIRLTRRMPLELPVSPLRQLSQHSPRILQSALRILPRGDANANVMAWTLAVVRFPKSERLAKELGTIFFTRRHRRPNRRGSNKIVGFVQSLYSQRFCGHCAQS